MGNLKTTYKDDVLDTNVNTTRVFDILDSSNNVVEEDVHFRDETDYTQNGDSFGASDINAITTRINNNSKNIPWYANCSTGASTVNKVATSVDEIFLLQTGAKISVKFDNENTASEPTLNVDSTGAIPIKTYGSTVPNAYWKAGDIVNFIYDGTNFIMGASASVLDSLNVFTKTDDSFGLIGTSEGLALASTIYGMSEQDGTPTPSVPVDIDSAVANFKCVGKNLIPYPYHETTKTSGSLTFTDLGDGRISLNGSTDATVRWFQFAYTPSPFILKKGTYKFKCNVASGTFSGNNCGIYLNSSQWSGWQYVAFGYESDITLTEDVIINNAGIRIVSATLENCVIEPLLIFSTVSDSTYEPYQSKSITTNLTLKALEVESTDDYNLVKDGKYYIADTLDWDEDSGYSITRRINRVNANDLTWSWWSTYVFASLPDTKSRQGLSNRFQYKSGGIDSTDGFAFSGTYPNIHLNVYNTQFTTKAEYTTWFSQNTVIFDYVLATPTSESVTSAQAQALLGLKTYDEATSIDGTGDVAPSVTLNYAISESVANALTGHNLGYIGDLKCDDLNTSFSNALTDLKATAIAQAVGANGSTFTSVIAKLGEIVNRGSVSQSLNPNASYTLGAGYYSGGTVSANANTQTYSVTSNGTKDMGIANLYRYLNVNVNQSISLANFDPISTDDPSRTYTYDSNNIYIIVTFEHVNWQSRVKIYCNGSYLVDYARRDTSEYTGAGASISISGNNITLTCSVTTIGYAIVLHKG